MSLINKAVEWVREPTFAMLGVTATEVSGTALAAPAWLIGVGQAAIVVVFTVKAIDKRQSKLHEVANTTLGKVEVLEAKFSTLPCIKDPTHLAANCPGKDCEGCKC